MDSRVILVGSLVGFLKKRSSSVVTQSVPHLLSCRRATLRQGQRSGVNIGRRRPASDAIHHAANRLPATLF